MAHAMSCMVNCWIFSAFSWCFHFCWERRNFVTKNSCFLTLMIDIFKTIYGIHFPEWSPFEKFANIFSLKVIFSCLFKPFTIQCLCWKLLRKKLLVVWKSGIQPGSSHVWWDLKISKSWSSAFNTDRLLTRSAINVPNGLRGFIWKWKEKQINDKWL